MADEWLLDPNRIIAMGNSSGAMAPLFMTYESVGWCQEGNSGTPGEDSTPNGVVSISGWYHEPWIKDIGTSSKHPPIIQVTWREDQWTPYEKVAVAIYD